MEDMNDRLSALGKAVAEVSDREADPQTLAHARRRWLSFRDRRRRPAWASRRALSFAVAALALVSSVGMLWVLRSEPAPLSFTVEPHAARGIVGEWVTAPDTDARDIRFTDGSLLELTKGARMRVRDIQPQGADVVLDQGVLRAIIKHSGPSSTWRVHAGPFTVRVTGTIFDVGWDPTIEMFNLSLAEGSVVVTGPTLVGGRVVKTGEQLSVRLDGRQRPDTDEPLGSRMDMRAPPATSPVDEAHGRSVADDEGTLKPDPKSTNPGSFSTDWRALLRSNEYIEAVDAVERAGLSRTLESASVNELYGLSDAARFASRPALARQALLTLRNTRGVRGRTAFLLGKIAADQQGSPSESVRWLEQYLQEQPDGPLVEQALGRILQIKQKTNPVEARRLAHAYLERYPNGGYSALARSVITP